MKRRKRDSPKLCSSALKTALDELVAARRAEGARLAEVIAGQLEQIARLTERAANAEARQPEAVRAKLAEQLRRIAENGAGLDAERLHQEALLIATKADIQEELDRLRAHIARPRETCSRRISRSGESSISWRRNSIAKPTRSAPRRPISRSAAPAWS